MWHSCRVVGLDEHFKGRPPVLRRLFDAWCRYVGQFGDFTIIPQKTRISFQTRVRFSGAVIRRDGVQCGFWLRRRVSRLPAFFGPVEFIPPGYFVYRFHLTDPRQLRAPGLKPLVRESYELGWQRRPAPAAASQKPPPPKRPAGRSVRRRPGKRAP